MKIKKNKFLDKNEIIYQVLNNIKIRFDGMIFNKLNQQIINLLTL